jgi:cytoskeletal protein CcmA (bactofilin family)
MGEIEKDKTQTSLVTLPQNDWAGGGEGTPPEIDSGQLTALLDHGATFEGRLTFEGTVRIGGVFKGEIFTRDTLIINAGAKVEAQIEADVVIISGQLVGNVFARRRVIMHPPAAFKGTVTSPSLRIDEGVMFEGASYMPKN